MPERYFKEETFTSQFNAKTVLRVLKLSKPHWPLLAGFLIFIMLTSFFDSVTTYIVKRIIDDGILAKNIDKIISNSLMYGVIIVIVGGTVFGFIRCAGLMGEYIQYDLKKKLFNHLQQLSFSYFDRTPVGWIMSRITSDTRRIAELATWMLVDFAWAVTNIISSMVFMFIINWRLTFIVITTLPVLILTALKFKKYVIDEYRKVRSINSRITGAYNENITGVRVIKALVREEENLRNFNNLSGSMFKASFRAAWLSAIFLPVVQIITAVGVGAVVWYGGFQIRIGGLTIGGIKAFISYILFMMWPVMDLSRVYAEIQHSIAGAERVFSLIDSRPEVDDRQGCVEADEIQGRVDFKDVTFYYEKNKPVLKKFSFSVKPGESIALVGPTGGGKTTIINLICRFYEPRSGRIFIDGRDYTEYSLNTLQSKLGVVLQTPHLFSGNIRENIRYGRLDASDEEVYTASKLAHAHDFIQTLKMRYDEDVGEGGVLLSVGQKQLISIARAILARPRIIIMDEATSSIDTLTESLIQKGMECLMKNCTSFIIAHRLSTIRHSDRIIVIDKGKIKESGTHRELLALEGDYYKIYKSQFREEKERYLLK